MSLSTRQTMSIIAMTSGCMSTIEANGLADHVLPTALYIKDEADKTLVAFNELATGDLGKNYKWMQAKVEEWNAYIRTHVDSKISAIVLTQMCLLALDELLIYHVRDPRKIRLLLPLEEALKGLSDQLDPNGDAYAAYAEAEEVTFSYFKILELPERSRRERLTLAKLQEIADSVYTEKPQPDPRIREIVNQMQFGITRTTQLRGKSQPDSATFPSLFENVVF